MASIDRCFDIIKTWPDSFSILLKCIILYLKQNLVCRKWFSGVTNDLVFSMQIEIALIVMMISTYFHNNHTHVHVYIAA
jgi:hypothetical protein